MSSPSESEILARLSGTDPESAWADFLESYSPLIYQVARRFDADEDRLADAYLYACRELHRNDYRRLRAFRADGPASFATWLRAVVRNLCLDWRRQALGNPRLFRCVSRRPPLDQEVFRCVYNLGMTLDETLGSLRAAYRDLDRRRLEEILTDLHRELTSRQFWLLGSRWTREESLSASREEGLTLEERLSGPEPDPEVTARATEQGEAVWSAVSELPAEDRLLLRLRYELDLPLREVARLSDLPDPQTAHRRIAKALRQLEAALEASGRKPR